MITASSRCGCCEGVESLTPLEQANRPGLTALSYRAGTYATFFETMVARLSNYGVTIGRDTNGKPILVRPLTGLTTREQSDPAIALLDAWAVVADVLTFYDERIANEGYLRTATERRSVVELARLIGYTLRPGVASTAYLAYTIDEDRSVTPPKGMEVTIPAGSRAQSIPEPGELPQPFETAEALRARTAWNKLQPRMSRPQTAESVMKDGLWLKGTATNLKANDPLLIGGLEGEKLTPMRVLEVTVDSTADTTHLRLRPWGDVMEAVAAVLAIVVADQTSFPAGSANTAAVKETVTTLTALAAELEGLGGKPAAVAKALDDFAFPRLLAVHEALPANATKVGPWLERIVEELKVARSNLPSAAPPPAPVAAHQTESFFDSISKGPSIPPANASQLPRSLETAFQTGGDVFPRVFTTFQPGLKRVLGPALANATVTNPTEIKVYALRISASLFAHNAPSQPLFFRGKVDDFIPPTMANTWHDLAVSDATQPFVLALDGEYDQLKPGSLMLIERPASEEKTGLEAGGQGAAQGTPTLTQHTVTGVDVRTMSAYGVAGKVKQTRISPEWLPVKPDILRIIMNSVRVLRGTRVYTQSELLPLAEAPITDEICDAEIELDAFYEGIEPGRWVILSGDRADVLDAQEQAVPGIQAAELAMILSVAHRVSRLGGPDGPALPGDKTHTFITLSTKPTYCYERNKITIYGNVAKATHGETRREVLGSGDASKPLQRFTLRQSPLTFLPAATPAGAASTLVVRVNEVEWHETETLAGLAPDDRKFVTQTDDESKTAVLFGNGWQGARPPTGKENITAVYRSGIGRPGNVKPGQISQLLSRPLGVKEVVNPLAATGGADREDRDQARKNAPLGVLALDRIVSVQDYANFARTFAGIGKASALKLSAGGREIVHLTIAGADDIPIDRNSDLYRQLSRALRDLGDPHLPIQIDLREMLSLVIAAKVAVLPDYAWEFVEPKVRGALLDVFGFERRELAEDVTKSEVIAAIQAVPGVAYVDLDCLSILSEKIIEDELVQATLNTTDAGEKEEEARFSTKLQESSVKHRVKVYPARPDPTVPGELLPAQIAALWPSLPETLVLTELK
jgi:hypothetical protein